MALNIHSEKKIYKLIYGYKKDCLKDIENVENSHVILIEPRSEYIDEIKKLKQKSDIKGDFILITKVLVKENSLSETILYFNKDTGVYSMKKDDLIINGVNLFNIKKYVVHTTSIENIIKQFNIQNIESLIININIENCNEILQSIESYNHILSKIHVNSLINYKCKILDNFYCQIENENTIYTHKNLNIKLPNILLYLSDNVVECKQIKEMSLFLKQYKMNLVINLKETGSNSTKKIILYPESINYIENIKPKPGKVSLAYYENIINNLECIFDKNKSIPCPLTRSALRVELELDMIIQFNSKYFNSKNTLQIMYPLQDNILYVNKMFDIIYGTKNCMFMLYQILKSKYFTDYINTKIEEKKTLFKIFSKRYFYDYISKIFVLKEIL